ncbi:hypothetical protein [Marinivivus vitaminiproducens]|uniref:hypothetical protein n=1 Tax=Marinivivus vitaminiproducens TaxID=3035935 RepID=UPI0027A4A135|nr:hypothetical protein P4R82_07250 [Geminicoccaceae bacterium SCSIO 64248]
MLKRALASGLVLLAVAAAPATADTLLAPTPLILKDGRISQVTIHTLAFPLNQSRLTAEEQGRLSALAASVATDCFLTAQSVGHVARQEATGQPADAHSLARARADEVQRALVNVGLPVDAIASVWDWQFLVDAPRGTLWVFALAEGEDCTGTPLHPELVAAATAPQAQAAPATGPAVPTETAEATPDAPPPPAPEVETTAAPESAPDAMAPPAAKPATVTAAADRPAAEPPQAARTAIVFDSNSSFFPNDAEAKLRALLSAIPAGSQATVQIDTSVGRGDVRGASSTEQAAAYNRWLATRRADRVREWLDTNGGGRSFTFRNTFVQDESRQVEVTADPAG